MVHGNEILSPEIIEKMTTPQQPANSTILRGLGWDIDSPFSSNRGELLPVGSYSHTGFTGTSVWIDPLSQTYIIILTNAVHPRGGEKSDFMCSPPPSPIFLELQIIVKGGHQATVAGITHHYAN